MSDVTLREFQSRDLPGVLEVLDSAMTADSISEARFTRQVLLDANFRSAGAPVAIAGGTVAGFCLSIARQVPLENAPPDADRGYITLLAVAPAFQRRGIGGMLLHRAEDYLKSHNRAIVMISSYAPGYFTPGVDVNSYAAGLAFLQKHGYAEVYRPLAMQTSLWELRVPPWVIERREKLAREGVTIEPYRPELTLGLLEFARKEFAGDWVRFVRETAGKILAGDSPSRLIAAIERGRVIGYSHYDNERFGPIGVEQSQRGRGIGQVLMYATLDAQRSAGFRAAWFLWSDDKTADRIYTAAGFKETRRFALMKKTLEA